MKVAIVNDTHFGVRNDAEAFFENQMLFWEEVFFPEVEKRDITQMIFAGDVFDRRKYVNFHTLDQVKLRVFDRLVGVQVRILLGNHDVFFKNTNRVNSPNLLLNSYDNVIIQGTPVEVYFEDGTEVALCPWLNSENSDDFIQQLSTFDCDVLLGHFEIKGFKMHKDGATSRSGLASDVLKGFRRVYSGHFHEPSTDGHIVYLGAPSEYTWADHDSKRGFNILDTVTGEVEFIHNPHTMHCKVFFDSKLKVRSHDFCQYAGKIVEVVVAEKMTPKKIDGFVNKIKGHNPHELNVVDNISYHMAAAGVVSEETLKTQDTVTIAEEFIDSVEDESTLDTGRVKETFNAIYVEALRRRMDA